MKVVQKVLTLGILQLSSTVNALVAVFVDVHSGASLISLLSFIVYTCLSDDERS